MPEYHIRKSKISLAGLDPETIFEHLRGKYREYKQNFEDGLRIDFSKSWVNFRRSNTEPIMRIITEAGSAAEAEEMQKQFHNDIKQFLKKK